MNDVQLRPAHSQRFDPFGRGVDRGPGLDGALGRGRGDGTVLGDDVHVYGRAVRYEQNLLDGPSFDQCAYRLLIHRIHPRRDSPAQGWRFLHFHSA